MCLMATIPAVDKPLWLLMALAFLASFGCSGSSLTPAFESVDPKERTAALLQAARTGDSAAIPQLIVMLSSGDPAERMLAGNALRRLTGLDFGYEHYDLPWKREEAADRWRRWWESQSAAAANLNEPMVSRKGREASEAP